MNYRQWKKNYKKEHGANPPLELDIRKQRRFTKRAIKKFNSVRMDLNVAARRIEEAFTNVFDRAESIVRTFLILCQERFNERSKEDAGKRD